MNTPNLISLIAKGDDKAFSTLYDTYKNRVFNTVLGYLQNREEAEEVAQDVFIEVFRSSSNFKGESSESTWIYRIAINKSLDHLRHKGRKKRFAFLQSLFNADTGALQHDVPHFEHPGILLENKDKAAILFKAIDTLSESQKTAYILSFVEDLSGKEVAEVMNLSPKAVESLLQRAKAGLRKELEKYYPERRKLK